MGALILATIVSACAIGVAATRADEPMPIVSSAPLPNQKPKKVVVIGDSYTEGTAYGGVGDKNWVQLAWRQLRREGVDITPKVSRGDGSGYVSRGLTGTTFGQEARALMEDDEDLVMIFGGSNDITAPPESVTASVRETLSDVRARTPKAKLIVVGPVWPGPDAVPDILMIRDIVRAEAKKTNATFVDPIADGWFMADSQLIGKDGVHPTDLGHLYMSERLLPVIKKELAPPLL
jgi:lysophospholipase L1-like esterase